MNTALWVCQILLALTFLTSGVLKAFGSKEWLIKSGQTGVAHLPVSEIRFIAICEILGAIGLVAPWLLQIYPFLTPIAAACLGVVMILASRIHARLHEPRNIAINFALLTLCALVVFGRLH